MDLLSPGWLAAMVVVGGLLAMPIGRAFRRFVGPVFAADLVRQTRRGRHVSLRVAYLLVLLVLLGLLYVGWLGPGVGCSGWEGLFDSRTALPSEVARFAEAAFFAFLAAQLAAVLVLTPVYTAGAVAEERERGTLAFLLTSPLSNREIVLGKFLSRLAYLSLFLLAGLPVLGFVQLLGGVDPKLVFAGFAATGLFLLSLGSLGVATSVRASQPRDAILATYKIAVGYLVASTFCCTPVFRQAELLHLSLGSPALLWLTMQRAESPIEPMLGYAAFHLVATVVLLAQASIELRRPRTTERGRAAFDIPPDAVIFVRPAPVVRAAPVGDRPVLWRELRRSPWRWANDVPGSWPEIFVYVGVLWLGMLLAAGVVMVFVGALGMGFAEGKPGVYVGVWLQLFATPAACAMWLPVGLRAAGAVASERERQTLDNLLATPLPRAEILWDKGLGAVLSVREVWWFIGFAYVLSVPLFGLHPALALLVVLGWLAVAAFVASLGLCVSLASRTVWRASVVMLLLLLAICLVPLAAAPALAPERGHGSLAGYWTWMVLRYGLSPPVALHTLTRPLIPDPFAWDGPGVSAGGQVAAAVAGLALYAALSVVLWQLARRLFAGSRRRAAPRSCERPARPLP